MLIRQQLADLWREASQITRADIFGPDDELRPVYPEENRILRDQIDLPMVGMVGPRYLGRLVILSVSPSGGRYSNTSWKRSDLMYQAIRSLRDSIPGASALDAFEQQNLAALASVEESPAGGGTASWRINQILRATECSLEDIANLTVVPFRTSGDKCTAMSRRFLRNGYQRHLLPQLRALEPELIVAIDKPSKEASERYKIEAYHAVQAIYLTGRQGAKDERARTLVALAAQRICGPSL